MRIDDVELGVTYKLQYYSEPFTADQIVKLYDGGRHVRSVQGRLHRSEEDGGVRQIAVAARGINEPWERFEERQVARMKVIRQREALEARIAAVLPDGVEVMAYPERTTIRVPGDQIEDFITWAAGR
jgi:hypothetical protein